MYLDILKIDICLSLAPLSNKPILLSLTLLAPCDVELNTYLEYLQTIDIFDTVKVT